MERRGAEGRLLRLSHRRVAAGRETCLWNRFTVEEGLQASVLRPARFRGTRSAGRILSRPAEQSALFLGAPRRQENAGPTDPLSATADSRGRYGALDRSRSDPRKRMRRGHRDEELPALSSRELPGPQHGPQWDQPQRLPPGRGSLRSRANRVVRDQRPRRRPRDAHAGPVLDRELPRPPCRSIGLGGRALRDPRRLRKPPGQQPLPSRSDRRRRLRRQ